MLMLDVAATSQFLPESTGARTEFFNCWSVYEALHTSLDNALKVGPPRRGVESILIRIKGTVVNDNTENN